MADFKPHLEDLAHIERGCLPGLVEFLRTERVEGVCYALWDMTHWHRGYDSLSLAEPRHRRAEAGGLGDVGTDGEDYCHGP